MADPGQRGQLVDLETDTVTEPVEEPVFQHLARLLVQLRLVAGPLEDVANELEKRAADGAGLDGGARGLDRIQDQPEPLLDSLGWLSYSARNHHDPVAREPHVPGEAPQAQLTIE